METLERCFWTSNNTPLIKELPTLVMMWDHHNSEKMIESLAPVDEKLFGFQIFSIQPGEIVFDHRRSNSRRSL